MTNGRPAIAPPSEGVIRNGKQASTARSASSTKRWRACLSPSRWEKVTRGLPKIEPSRFIISMIVSREPAGPERLTAHAGAELALKLHERVGRRRLLGKRTGRASGSRDQGDHRPDAVIGLSFGTLMPARDGLRLRPSGPCSVSSRRKDQCAVAEAGVLSPGTGQEGRRGGSNCETPAGLCGRDRPPRRASATRGSRPPSPLSRARISQGRRLGGSAPAASSAWPRPTIRRGSTKTSSSPSTPSAESTTASRRCTRSAIGALELKEGETVVQIGAGAGYYTAILAELVGREGRVTAYEIAPDIAARAAANLARYPQVEVRARSGVEDLPQADAIYVNAAATHPLRAWLDALKVGGRLVFPLQAARSTGAMLMVTRPERGDAWPARLMTGVVFIPCEGAQDAGMGVKLDAAFRRGGSERVRSLRSAGSRSRADWLRGDGWALSTEPSSGTFSDARRAHL